MCSALLPGHLSIRQSRRNRQSRGQRSLSHLGSASGWAAADVAAHRWSVRGLKASGRYGGLKIGERPGARLSDETAFLMLPTPWATSPASSAALGSCRPLCAQWAPDANDARRGTRRPLTFAEGCWSSLASIIVHQSRRERVLNDTDSRLGRDFRPWCHGTIVRAVIWRAWTFAKSRRFTVATVVIDRRSHRATTEASVPPMCRSA
jgi:hypothetical protein